MVCSTELRSAAEECKQKALEKISADEGISFNDLLSYLYGAAPTWAAPAVRTAMWDLLEEKAISYSKGGVFLA